MRYQDDHIPWGDYVGRVGHWEDNGRFNELILDTVRQPWSNSDLTNIIQAIIIPTVASRQIRDWIEAQYPLILSNMNSNAQLTPLLYYDAAASENPFSEVPGFT